MTGDTCRMHGVCDVGGVGAGRVRRVDRERDEVGGAAELVRPARRPRTAATPARGRPRMQFTEYCNQQRNTNFLNVVYKNRSKHINNTEI